MVHFSSTIDSFSIARHFHRSLTFGNDQLVGRQLNIEHLIYLDTMRNIIIVNRLLPLLRLNHSSCLRLISILSPYLV